MEEEDIYAAEGELDDVDPFDIIPDDDEVEDEDTIEDPDDLTEDENGDILEPDDAPPDNPDDETESDDTDEEVGDNDIIGEEDDVNDYDILPTDDEVEDEDTIEDPDEIDAAEVDTVAEEEETVSYLSDNQDVLPCLTAVKAGDTVQIMIVDGEPTVIGTVGGEEYKANTDLSNVPDQSVTARILTDGSVTELKIQDGAITELKIVDAAITNAKIADAAIDSAKIEDAAITEAKIEDASISTAKIQNGAITNAKIAEAAIGEANIQDASITNAKIATGAIDTAKIKEGAITTATIGTGAITGAKIADAAITNAHIDSLNADKITSGTLQTERLILVDNDSGKTSIVTALNAEAEANGGILNGATIIDGTVEAAKINVADLEAFQATIGGFDIDSSSIHSKKTAINDPTAGVYLGTTGLGIGDGELAEVDGSPLEVYADGTFKLQGKNGSMIFDPIYGSLNIDATEIKMQTKTLATTTDLEKFPTSTYEMYAVSTSSTEAPEDGWSTATPEWTEGSYIWRKVVSVYESGEIVSAEPALLTGNTGNTGVSVSSVVRYYILATEMPEVPTTNPPNEDWSTSEPAYNIPENIAADNVTNTEEETESTETTEGETTDDTVTDATNDVESLYYVDLFTFSDDTWAYSDVSQSFNYDAINSLAENQNSASVILAENQQWINTFEQSDGFKFNFEYIDSKVAEVDGKITTQYNEGLKYIHFDEGDIILGESEDNSSLVISNDRVSFRDTGTEVAYISDETMNITNAEIEQTLRIGNFEFVVHGAKNNLGLRWAGNS